MSNTKTCTKCSKDLEISNFYTSGKKVDGTLKYNSWCKECISKKMKSYHEKTWSDDKLQYTAYKRTKTVKSYLSYLRGKAIQRKSFCISLSDLEDIWISQNGKCALTGWDLTMILGNGNIDTNASIDRIDSSLGYVSGNVQLICRALNVFKSDMSEDFLINMCEAVVKYNFLKNESKENK